MELLKIAIRRGNFENAMFKVVQKVLFIYINSKKNLKKRNLTYMMTPIQTEISNTLIALKDKSRFTDAVLAKKLRELAGIIGKNKATVALADLMAATSYLEAQDIIYSITVTASNTLILERTDSIKELPLDQIQRRQRSEKSQVLFTTSDLKHKASKSDSKKKSHGSHDNTRTVRKSLNINKDYEEWE